MQSFQEDGRISSKIKRLHTRARHVCVQQWVDKKWQVRWRILEKKLQSILVGWKMYARIGRSIPTQASKNEWVNSYIYPVPLCSKERSYQSVSYRHNERKHTYVSVIPWCFLWEPKNFCFVTLANGIPPSTQVQNKAILLLILLL